MSKSRYRLVSSSQYQSVSPGAKVTYEIEQTQQMLLGPDTPRDRCRWFCLNDQQAAREHGVPYVAKGPTQAVWKDATWCFPGKHTLECHVEFGEGGAHVYSHPQLVEPVETILTRELERIRRGQGEAPEVVRSALSRWVGLLEDIEKKHPIKDRAKKEQHDKEVQAYKAYITKLDEVLQPTEGKVRRPIPAFHLEAESQNRTDVRVFAARLDDSTPEKWVLVDWTDPTERTRTGSWEREDDSTEGALREVIGAWDSGFCGNRYPKGIMKYQVPGLFGGQFTTSGRSTLDAITSVLEWIGMIAAGIAMLVALIAPVPGSQLVAGLIWASVFSSTAAAVINISQRHAEGFGNFRDDAFDTLTIAGNLFAGAGTWVKGATVITRGVGGVLMKGALIAQISTDVVQGVILGIDYVGAYDKIMADETLLPSERAARLMELLRSAAIAGALTYVSVKGNARDLANLDAAPRYLKDAGAPKPGGAGDAPGTSGAKPQEPTPAPKPPQPEAQKPAGKKARKGTPREKLEALKDPNETVDLTRDPIVEGHTKDREVKTTAQVETPRAKVKEKAKSKFEEEFPDDGEWIGRRLNDEYIWLERAREGRAPDPDLNWVFEARYDKGTIHVYVRTVERDASGALIEGSDRLRAKDLYPMMFEHFEAKNLPIKRWEGPYAWANYAEVKRVMAAGAAPEEAVLLSKTAKYWKEWAESRGLKPKVEYAFDNAAEERFHFAVDFIPK